MKVTPLSVAETLKDNKKGGGGGVVAHALTSGSTSATLLQMFSHSNLSCRFYKHAKENGALARTGYPTTPFLASFLSHRPPACPANGRTARA